MSGIVNLFQFRANRITKLHTREPVFCCRGGSLGWRPPAPSPPLECAERGQALLSATLHSQLPDIITISTGSLVEAWLEREILTALSAISNSVCRKISSWLGEGNSEIFEKKRSGCRSRISQWDCLQTNSNGFRLIVGLFQADIFCSSNPLKLVYWSRKFHTWKLVLQ